VDAEALWGGSAPSAASGASARDAWQLAAGGRADTWLLYVDRNPRAFAVVLDLIRCGKVLIPPDVSRLQVRPRAKACNSAAPRPQTPLGSAC